MRWPTLLISMGWLAIFVVDLEAEQPTFQSPPPLPANDYLPSPTLLRQNPAANFHLVLGRLQLDPVRYRKGSFSLTHAESPSNADAGSTPPSITESMTVNGVRGKPSMQYVMTRPQARVTIDADSQGNWRIQTERRLSAHQRKLLIEQVIGKPLRMRCTMVSTNGSPDDTYTVQGTTLLHLREADRATFIEDLEPILDELLCPYRIQDLSDQAHAFSLRQSTDDSDTETLVDDATLQTWIHELRSPSRLRRTDAERKLLSVGIALLPRLASIDPSSLDSEQRYRLNQIRTRLTPLAEDDAARLATLIRDDREYWRLAASRLDDRELLVMNRRFQNLGGIPLLPNDSARIATRPVTRDR
jgi:hypothetical protein